MKIKIICNAPSHPHGRVTTVALLARTDLPPGACRWEESLDGLSVEEADRIPRSTTDFDGDTLLDISTMPNNVETTRRWARARGRYEFRCPDCGLVVVSRAEKLDPKLDAAASAGHAEVLLHMLSG